MNEYKILLTYQKTAMFYCGEHASLDDAFHKAIESLSILVPEANPRNCTLQNLSHYSTILHNIAEWEIQN